MNKLIKRFIRILLYRVESHYVHLSASQDTFNLSLRYARYTTFIFYLLRSLRDMGHSVELVDKDENPVQVPYHRVGSNVVVYANKPKTVDASLTVTYNYSGFYKKHLSKKSGICWLEKKGRAGDTIDRLERAVEALGALQREKETPSGVSGDDVQHCPSYWEPTPSNAGYVLSVLLEWAKLHPNAVWIVD